MASNNKVCVNIDQTDPESGGFTDAEKLQARNNIGACGNAPDDALYANHNGKWFKVNFVTPEMFGAKGDGATDDTAAFEAALAASDYVMLSDKVYIVGDIILDSGKHVIGIGPQAPTVLRIADGASCIFSIPGSRFVELKDISLAGGTSSSPKGVGLLLSNDAAQLYFERCVFSYFDCGVKVPDTDIAWDCIFTQCNFSSNVIGCEWYGSTASFSHCKFYRSKDTGIILHGTRRMSFDTCGWTSDVPSKFITLDGVNLYTTFFKCNFEVGTVPDGSSLFFVLSTSKVVFEGCVIRAITAQNDNPEASFFYMNGNAELYINGIAYSGNSVPNFLTSKYGTYKKLVIDQDSIPPNGLNINGSTAAAVHVEIVNTDSVQDVASLPSFLSNAAGTSVYVRDLGRRLLWDGTAWVNQSEAMAVKSFGSDSAGARTRYTKILTSVPLTNGASGVLAFVSGLVSTGYRNYACVIASLTYIRRDNGNMYVTLCAQWPVRQSDQQLYYEIVTDSDNNAYINIYMYMGAPLADHIPRVFVKILCCNGDFSIVSPIALIADSDFALLSTNKARNLLDPVHGDSTQRPALNGSTDIGYQYFDTTLGKPIYWQGTKWIYADGTDVV